MKPGDIIQTFGNPIKLEHPIGQAKLIKKLSDHDELERWEVEYLDHEGYTYNIFIKKNGTHKTNETVYEEVDKRKL